MLAAATSNSDAHDTFRSGIQNYLLTALSGVIGGDEQARTRALSATSMVGREMLRYVTAVSPLATLSNEEVVRLIAPTVTRYLTADTEELGLSLRRRIRRGPAGV